MLLRKAYNIVHRDSHPFIQAPEQTIKELFISRSYWPSQLPSSFNKKASLIKLTFCLIMIYLKWLYFRSKGNIWFKPCLGPGYFLSQLSDCIMETCMLWAGGEGPWVLVTPVKAVRIGVEFIKKWIYPFTREVHAATKSNTQTLFRLHWHSLVLVSIFGVHFDATVFAAIRLVLSRWFSTL